MATRPRPVTIPGVDDVELRALRTFISGELIVAECVVGHSGTGYDVEVRFQVNISLELENGVIHPKATLSEPDADIKELAKFDRDDLVAGPSVLHGSVPFRE